MYGSAFLFLLNWLDFDMPVQQSKNKMQMAPETHSLSKVSELDKH